MGCIFFSGSAEHVGMQYGCFRRDFATFKLFQYIVTVFYFYFSRRYATAVFLARVKCIFNARDSFYLCLKSNLKT